MNIDLWCWDLDVSDAECRCLSGVLSGEELARAARFIRPVHAARYTVGRGRLRQILGWYTGQPPAALAFRSGAQGKPYLSGSGRYPFFSLSHSGSTAMLGIAEVELGIDLELIRPIQEQVENFFSPAEQAALSRMAGAERIGGFYRCWTRKEAVLKALGGGLSIGLTEFDVSLDKDEPARLLRLGSHHGAVNEWSLHGVERDPRWIGAIAIRSGQHGVRVVEHALSGA